MARRSAQGKEQDHPTDELTLSTAPTMELDASLQDFLLEHGNGADYKCSIYRRYTSVSGKEQHSYLTEFPNEIPTYEALRRLMGPGLYRINVTYTDRHGKRSYTSRNVELDQDPAARVAAAAVPAPIAATPQGLQSSDLVSLLNTLIKTIGDITKGQGNGKSAASELGEIAAVFAQSMGAMASQQVGIMGQMQRQLLDLPDQQPEQKRPEGLVDLLVWAWNTFGQKLLQNPALGKMFAPQVQTMPQVQYLVNNPDEYERVINEFTEREGVNPDSLAQLLGALDMPLPNEIRAATAAAVPPSGEPTQAP